MRSKFNAIGGRTRRSQPRGRKRFMKHFTYGTVFRLRLAAKRKQYGVGARSAIIMRQRRAVASALRRGNRKAN